jgi:hypothetical protein
MIICEKCVYICDGTRCEEIIFVLFPYFQITSELAPDFLRSSGVKCDCARRKEGGRGNEEKRGGTRIDNFLCKKKKKKKKKQFVLLFLGLARNKWGKNLIYSERYSRFCFW